MLQFIREKSSMVLKLVCYQLAMIVFTFATTMPAAGSPNLLLGISIFTVCFYLFLCYNALWNEGAKDAVKIDHGRMEYRPLGGLFLAVCANALNVILALWLPIARLLVLPSDSTLWEYFTSGAILKYPVWMHDLYAIPRWIAQFLQIPYAGIYTRFMPQNPLCYLLSLLLTLTVCTVAYCMGRKNIRVFPAAKTAEK